MREGGKQMTVLIVDDQKYVVEGLEMGVHWKSIGVGRVLTAFSAAQARGIMEEEQVDILLCDIEMPSENGLSLLAWIRSENRDVKCIFLTAHPDFQYAQTALRLGGFDYILQPARYEDVERAVTKACESVSRERERAKYYSYGKTVSQKRSHLLGKILAEWFGGDRPYSADLEQTLAHFGVELRPDEKQYFLLMQLCAAAPSWEPELLLYAVTNILREVLGETVRDVLDADLGEGVFGFLLLESEEERLNEDTFRQSLLRTQKLLRTTLCCGVAFHAQSPVAPAELSAASQRLRASCRDNVARRESLFWEPQPKEDCAIEYSRFENWRRLLAEGYVSAVRREMERYLEELAGDLNAGTLYRFQQAFHQIVFSVSLESRERYPGASSDEELVSCLQEKAETAGRLRELIHKAMLRLEEDAADGFGEEEEDLIEKAIFYIRSHIEEDLRRSTIAEAVHLSPNYLSGLFSVRMGMTLREFIVQEKMKTAQSLLKTTRLPIGVVAAKVGYSNFSYFSQLYKKCNGVSPGEDREA